jgi:hypothetical protein
MVTHKFRATLGKSKLVNRGERVLVCVSGSQSSVSLLHMIWTGLQQSTYKRLTFDPVVLYIDGNNRVNVKSINFIYIILNNFRKCFTQLSPRSRE